MIVYPGVIVVLLFLLSLISGSSAALSSLTDEDIQTLEVKNSAADNIILKLLSGTARSKATAVVAYIFFGIIAIVVSNIFLDKIVNFRGMAWALAIKTAVLAFVFIIFTQMIPRIAAGSNPIRFSRFTAGTMRFLGFAFMPATSLLVRKDDTPGGEGSRKKVNISIDELSEAIEITRHDTEDERRMLSGIVDFANTDAGEIMKLRMDIAALDIEADFAEVKTKIIGSGYSRIPVFSENIDHIRGILYVKDMLRFLKEGDDFPWQKHLRKAYFVPDNKKINDLLEEFRSNHVHLAIVVDEYGATQGLVSLEDILEEVVGEITDEYDAKSPGFYKKIDDNIFLFEGKTHLSDLEEVLGVGEDFFHEPGRECETLAGLLLELKRDFLKKGESITYKAVVFTVIALEGRRIDKVRVDISNLNQKEA